MARLLERFEDQIRADLQAIDDTARAGDSPGLARTCHGLRGSAAMLSAIDLSRAAGALEDAARENRLGAATDTVAEVHREIERCVVYLSDARGGGVKR